ncbi:MAG: type II toxin-antitoxin system HicB family antitoxin [Proteobacteria bacterium]|nr:type II toxin-antitoxin system HicB family antitoxin [Pseudomonadota bacterium]
MLRHFTLEYWIDDNWYVGRLKEVPGVFSQGETLEELENNIREAYQLMMETEDILPATDIRTKEIGVQV